jgi:kynurenine formamidase
MNQLIDVSHTIEHEMVTYKGLPAPLICDYLTRERSRQLYAPGTEFHIGKIEMIANTGTYVDSPFHRYEHGKDLAQLPLSSLANLETAVIHTAERVVDVPQLTGHDVRGKAVLIHTGWSQHWRTDQYFEDNPFLTAEAATYLRDEGAVMVGIDSLNIDNTADLARPAHTILLGADIPIVEHLTNLHTLPDVGCRFFAVPVKVKAFGTFPVRAFGIVGD